MQGRRPGDHSVGPWSRGSLSIRDPTVWCAVSTSVRSSSKTSAVNSRISRSGKSRHHSIVRRLRFFAWQWTRNSSRRSWSVSSLTANGFARIPFGVLLPREDGGQVFEIRGPRARLVRFYVRKNSRRLVRLSGYPAAGRVLLFRDGRPARPRTPRSEHRFRSGGGRESNPPGSFRPLTGFEVRGRSCRVVPSCAAECR
jgi:hypothetical protein